MPNYGQNGMTVLNVAEKNDAAKCISRIMSQGHSNMREGYSKFNKIYEFNYNILNCNCKMMMTSVSGHLLNVEFPGNYKNWQQCPPLSLFEAPLKRYVPDNFVNIRRTLEREVRKSQALIIWTDCDREGENIGFEIIEVCREVKPNIRIFRAKFSEITPRAIDNACRNLQPPDENQSNAVEVRRELDLRIGAAFTRFQTLRLQKRFPEVLTHSLISYGSCQFPTLGFVVERYKQVQDFVPETFYKIKVLHTKDDCQMDFSWSRGHLFHHGICSLFHRMCCQDGMARVVKVISRPKSKWRPLPLDTVELEKLASRKLRINAKETMKIAEKLYTQGFISYPRTETNIFPKTMNLTQIVESQTTDPQWGGFASNILNDGGPNPRQGKKTDNAHPPIHPTKYTNNLQGNEKRIYEFVVRHFLACVSKDAQGQETIVEIMVADEKFSASGLMILAKNYLDVYCYENWRAKMIAIYNEGETFTPDEIKLVDGETRAPPLLSEADLISLMEKNGIGTDATHAEHIETIKARSYVGVQNDGTFLPGQLGMGLVEGYDAMGFAMSKPHLRAALEADLKSICEGRKDKDVVLAEQIRSYREVFRKAAEQVEKLDNALSEYFGPGEQVGEDEIMMPQQDLQVIRKCNKCSLEDMVLRKSKDGGFMVGCFGFPECKNSIFFPKFVLDAKKTEVICNICRPPPVHKIAFKFKPGSVPPSIGVEYTGCIGGCDEMLSTLISFKEASRPAQNTQQPYRAELGAAYHNNRNNIGPRPNPHDNNSNRGRGTGRGSNNQGRGGNNNNKNKKPRGNFDTMNNEPNIIPNRSASNIMNQQNQHFSNNQSNFGNDGNNDIVCDCSTPAASRTVKKDGPNKGRNFFVCGSNNSCKFFLWADADNTNNTDRGHHSNASAQQSSTTGNDINVKCTCNQMAAKRTVQKDGPNKGRQFYCCPKPRDQQCGYFKWEDELDQGDSSHGGRGGFQRPGQGRGRGRGGSNTRKRKCRGCGQEGMQRFCKNNAHFFEVVN